MATAPPCPPIGYVGVSHPALTNPVIFISAQTFKGKIILGMFGTADGKSPSWARRIISCHEFASWTPL